MALLHRLGRLLLLLSFVTIALADDASDEQPVITSAEKDLPNWATDNTLQLELSTDSTNYAIIPLTANLARGGSSVARGFIHIEGIIKTARSSNYKQINDSSDVAYMCCDESDNHNAVDRSKMLNDLMGVRPRAIVLYSIARNWCSIQSERELPYANILSMVDPGEAETIFEHLNEIEGRENVGVTITGNTTGMELGASDGPSGGQSAVAMSVLYSITGIITLLFVVIITTGAVRAHRYPDRYGPRRAQGGRPRQSRAKGLARAVLETLPVVKFGDRQQQPKLDPDLELETATTDGQEPPIQRATSPTSNNPAQRSGDSSSVQPGRGGEDEGSGQDEAPGCSICTEDFKVGEDVRVLPCNHQYHPVCIDPWLINISGTCPLCRLNLQPARTQDDANPQSQEDDSLPPPLTLEREDNEAHTSHRNRFSRLTDISRFQQSSVEERMAAIRELRDTTAETEGPHSGSEADESAARHSGAPFADRLRERFRILTRSQPVQRRQC